MKTVIKMTNVTRHFYCPVNIFTTERKGEREKIKKYERESVSGTIEQYNAVSSNVFFSLSSFAAQFLNRFKTLLSVCYYLGDSPQWK